jgi:hypothetical protein
MCCFPTFVVCIEFSVMDVVYREISVVFVEPYKSYVLSVEIFVMNVV